MMINRVGARDATLAVGLALGIMGAVLLQVWLFGHWAALTVGIEAWIVMAVAGSRE